MNIGKDQKFALIIVPVLLSVGVYLNSLSGEFVSDDIYQVLRNPWIKDPGHLRDIFFSSVWSFMDTASESNYYRPMMYVSYSISHALSGLSPWGYHVVNVLIHAANAAMLFMLAARFWEKETEQGGSLAGSAPWFFALAAASLFAVHTVNSEAVAWIASVPELSYSLCFMLALYFFSSGRYALPALFFFLALLYKETAIIIPPMLFAFDLLYKRGESGERRGASAYWIRSYWPFVAAFVVYLVMRTVALGDLAPSAPLTGEAIKTFTPYGYAINILPTLYEYLGKLLYPADLVFYDHARVDTVASITEAKSIVLILAAALLLFALWHLRRRAPLLGLAVIWIALPLLPVLASGWVKGYPLFAERYLYLSTAGFALLLSYASLRFFSTFGRRRSVALLLAASLIVLTAVYSCATIKRNGVWENSYTLWRDTAIRAPHVVDARVNHANELSKQGRLDEALSEYSAALELDPARASLRNGLGILYAKKGLAGKAVKEFELALTLDPDPDEREAILKNLKKARMLLEEAR